MIETSVVIPSYRRPAGLQQAMRSVLTQKGVAAPYEIIVVDNDSERSAERVTAALAQESRVPVRYVSEPRPGISHARNAGVAAAGGAYLAFLDDDERVGPDWLSALLATLRRFGADAAVGPVLPQFPPDQPIDAYRRSVYTRDARLRTGTPLLRWNIGNSIFVKERCFIEAEPFDLRLGLTGGEDTVFLRRITRRGCRMVWCAEAVAWENVPTDRLDSRYLVRRAFRGAQTTTYACYAARPREFGGIARHMIVGAAQAMLWGPAALVMQLCRHQNRLPISGKAAAGLGKVLWHPKLHLRLYR